MRVRSRARARVCANARARACAYMCMRVLKRNLCSVYRYSIEPVMYHVLKPVKNQYASSPTDNTKGFLIFQNHVNFIKIKQNDDIQNILTFSSIRTACGWYESTIGYVP